MLSRKIKEEDLSPDSVQTRAKLSAFEYEKSK